jgi:DNA ligase-1
VKFAELCALCFRLEATRSRLAKVSATAEFLARLEPEEIRWAIAFLAARPFPTSDPRVLVLRWTAFDNLPAAAAAAEPALSILDVARAFAAIAEATGRGSRVAKRERLRGLFAAATAGEQEILRRIVHGEMRIGLHDGLIQEAIARAAQASLASVRRAALFVSDLSVVGEIALTGGAAALEQVTIRVFVPLLPMLAELAPDLEEVLKAHGGRTALEYKYDGARIQIHREGDEVRIWSRRLSEVTASLPDIVAIALALPARSLVLDGEIVAVGKDGRPLPFQELMRRLRRVHEIEQSMREIPLVLRLFDCLLIDGESLVDRAYEARWQRLERLTGGDHLARRLVTGEVADAEAFLREALSAGHEGLIAKDLASRYEPGSRGKRWFKIKPAETLDCVIVAADRGSGRRRGWLSNYHLAVLDDGGNFTPVGKTFKGLTDREFIAMTAALSRLKVADDGYTVKVRPEIVVEVAYNEIQRSPQYPSGFALRFARIARIRDDKSPAQASTLSELRRRYERQFQFKSAPAL